MFDESFITVGKECTTEFTEKKSIFISSVFVVTSQQEAEERVSMVRAQYPDATHHCYAYVLKQGAYRRFNDDGEPSGTAGMPILNVIDHLGLCNTLVVVTRYFGGIKLGAGGLVRAYSTGAAQVQTEAGKSIYVKGTRGVIEVDYDDHAIVERYLLANGVVIENKNFAGGVEMTVKMSNSWDEIADAVTDMCRGGAICEMLEHVYVKKDDINE